MDESQPHTRPGTLILVSTPIGNLGDMTYRGVETLQRVSAILAEDTRHTGRLLTHFGIENDLIPYHDHNKEKVTPAIISRLRSGEDLALVTDAGTPGVSDPGYYLVRAAVADGISITVVPGANAILPSLLLSGFPTDAFIFEGFLPRKKSELERKLKTLVEERRTVVYFVSPHRLLKVLEAIDAVLGTRTIAVTREITKLHEEVKRGTARELVEFYRARRIRGEIVVLISGRAKSRPEKKDKYK